MSDKQKSYQLKIEKTIQVNKSPKELYRFWKNLKNLPAIMSHLHSVEMIDSRHSHWVVDAPMGTQAEWTAELVTDVQNEVISWRSLEGADIENAGTVRFNPTPAGGTDLTVQLAYNPPGGAVGAALVKLWGQDPAQKLEEDLERFKHMMESGDEESDDVLQKQAQVRH